MKKLILIACISLLALAGCMDSGLKPQTGEEAAKGMAEVMDVVKQYAASTDNTDINKIFDLLDPNVTMFGTDSSEIVKSVDSYKQQIKAQIQQVNIKHGQIKDPWVMMDPYGTIASVIYGMPCVLEFHNGTKQDVFLRVALTLQKKDEKWLIISCVTGMAKSNPGGIVVKSDNIPDTKTEKK